MLRRKEVEEREERLRLRVRELPDYQRQLYFKWAKSRIKDPDTYAVLNFVCIAGLHHFYLGRWGRGFVNITVFLGGVVLLLIGSFVLNLKYFGIGVAVLVTVVLVEIPALFKSQIITQNYNNDVMERLLTDLDSQQGNQGWDQSADRSF
jgi:TM2 domain-containing membrane protein YozV